MRQARHLVLPAILALAILIAGCGGDDNGNGANEGPPASPAPGQSPPGGAKQTTTPQAPAPPSPGTGGGISSPTDLSAVAEQNRQTLMQMNQGKEVAAVTVETVQGLLPETLAGMKRTNVGAERNQSMGVDLTTGEATYEGQDNASIDLQITDIGNMTGAMRMGMAAWTMAQYNRQTTTGYEKTGTYSGYKGMEEYNNANQDGMLKIFVADRFIVELNGNGVTMDTLKQALGQIDLKKIASLASGT